MTGKTRTSLLSLTIIAVIMFSAFGPTTVFADGDPPPEAPPAETSAPPEDGSNPPAEAPAEVTAEATEGSDQTAVEAEVSTEAAPAATESAEATSETTANPEAAPVEGSVEAASTPDPAATEAASTPSVEEEAAPVIEESTPAPDSSVLNEVPADTAVTVLDANGEAQPLATQEAAVAIATSDPIWCPGTQSPTPGLNGCTDSFSSFDELLTELETGAHSGPGTIYVEQGAYQGGEQSIDFNAYSLGSISSAPLTITGGWNTGNGTIDPATPTTFNNVPILIGSTTSPWGGTLSLNNISMTFSNDNTSTANGITLNTQGDINLMNVDVTNAPNTGAELTAGGSVTIIDSSFSRNKNKGASINAGGNVSVITSDFSNPANARRQNTGLDIVKAGSVSLFDVLANENRLAGATINASGSVSITRSFFSGTKEILGTQFLGYGLKVITPSTIALDGVTANNNFLYGASLDGGGAIAIADSIFNANTTESPGFIDDTGLFVNGGSTVALNNVTADNNRLYGAQIVAAGTVTISTGSFSNNRGIINTGSGDTYNGHGLQITSPTGIFISNVTATNNMLFGAELNSSGGNVSISFSNFSNTSTGSSSNAVGRGLDIFSGGNTTLLNVILDNNQDVGAFIEAGSVTLNNVTATNNGSDGVVVQTSCTEVAGGTYTGNGVHGLNLGTSALALTTAPVGDIFPANPPTCTVLLTSANTGNNAFASLQTASLNTAATNSSSTATNNAAENVTLKNMLAKTMGGNFGIFIGKYAAVYSSSGLHIFVYSPSSNELAMDGS